MSESDRERWDAKYADREVADQLDPDSWLVRSVTEIPPGRALDLACGMGHNAVCLAQSGWSVDAVDISPVGLGVAKGLASRLGHDVHWINADLDDFVPEPEAYDLVLVFRFLDRQRLPILVRSALRPGGILVYQTYTTKPEKLQDSQPHDPAHILKPGEMPTLFPEFVVLDYRESPLESRCIARLLARKP